MDQYVIVSAGDRKFIYSRNCFFLQKYDITVKDLLYNRG